MNDATNDTHFINQTHKEVTCYSLPYGGIGFGSHILTYYSMIMFACGRRPTPPFRKLTSGKWDAVLGLAQLIGTVVLTSIAIHRCHDEWQFMLMGVWMLTTSMSAVAMNITGPLIAREGDLRIGVLFCVGVLWACGCIAGSAGLISIVLDHAQVNHRFYLIACIFGGIIFFGVLIGWYKCTHGSEDEGCTYCIVWPLIGICTLGLFWMDWSLGAVLGNLAGVPSKEASAIYWSYIVIKRLGLLSI
jgi:hypothetical protein